MKRFFYLLALCLALASAFADPSKPTGQPGCQTEEELVVRTYRHFYLKPNYWVCEQQGVPAVLAACPVATAWLDSVKACVPWAQWTWTPTVAPPSEPAPAVPAN